MSSIVAKVTSNKNDLPEDIFMYNHDQFYEFIERQCGPDLAELFRFQAIRNATHLLDTSCDDILLVLQQESDDITQLKELCCFQVVGNKYQVKLGVKLAINNLIELVKIKQQQQKKKKRSSIQAPSINRIQTPTQIETAVELPNETPVATQIRTLSLAPVPFTPLTSDTTSAQSRLPLKQKLNELDHIADIEERINKWWSTIDNSGSSLDKGTQYFLEINKSINNTFVCILTCQCYNRFKLPFVKPGFFKLSSFYRHFKEKQCLKLSKMKHGQENSPIIDVDSAKSQLNSSNRSLNMTSKKTTPGYTTSKRVSSATVSSMVKKKKTLSKNNTDSSEE
ncbi:unnamed protein product [Rotaria sp. Silwood2]|nr:unnamed protein product [Rotaria sp. Silwood2]CAF4191426.1 unnamed protein product [Rotaria sp. Silwood2]